MGIVKRQSIPTAVMVYLGIAIAFLNGAILFPRTVGVDIFGLTQWLIAVWAIFSLIGDLSASKIIVKYLPYFRSKREDHYTFFLLLFKLCTIGIVLSFVSILLFKETIISFFAKPESLSLVSKYFYLFPIGLIFYIYIEFLNSYCRSIYRLRIPTMFAEFYGKVFNTILLLCFYIGWIGLDTFLIFYIVKLALHTISLLFYIKWLKTPVFRSSISNLNIDPAKKKEMVTYGVTTILSGSGSLITRKIDILMIAGFLSFELTGVYSIIIYMTVAMTIPHKSISGILAPLVASAWKRGDKIELASIYMKSALNSSIFSTIVFLIYVINVDLIFSIIGGDVIGNNFTLFILCAGSLFFSICGVNGLILNYSYFFKYDILLKFGLVIITIVSNYLLIPVYGIIGAAIATMISVGLNNFAIVWLVYKKEKIHPFSKNLLRLLIIFLITVLLNFFLPKIIGFYTDLVIRNFLFVGSFIFLIYKFELSNDINSFLQETFERLKTKN